MEVFDYAVEREKEKKVRQLDGDRGYRRKIIENELECLNDVIEFVFEECDELLDKRIELMDDGKDLTDEEKAQLKLLEHLVNIYKGGKS